MKIGVSARIGANLLAFIAFAVGIVVLAVFTFASGLIFDRSYPVTVTIPDAGGVLPRQEVTVMGRSIGTVQDAELVEGGVRLTFAVQPQFSAPARADVRILRRSPVGEQAVELTPSPAQGWTAVERGGAIEVDDAIEPTTVSDLLDNTVALFQEVSPENTAIVVHELATALDGRADIIRELNDSTLDLSETILAGQDEIRRLFDTAEPLVAELDEHADDLIRLFDNGAELSEVLANNRSNLEELLRVTPNALGEAEALIINVRADAQCVVRDLNTVNDMLLGPSTATGAPARLYETKLDEVQMAIDKHRFFFQLGLPLVIQPDPETGLGWARVKFELDKLGSGDLYAEPRPTPPTLPGAACETEEWGTGVNAVRQPDAQPADPTSPGILFAPLVEETGARAAGPDGSPDAVADGSGDGAGDPEATPVAAPADRPALPATGGGLALLALSLSAAGVLASRRR